MYTGETKHCKTKESWQENIAKDKKIQRQKQTKKNMHGDGWRREEKLLGCCNEGHSPLLPRLSLNFSVRDFFHEKFITMAHCFCRLTVWASGGSLQRGKSKVPDYVLGSVASLPVWPGLTTNATVNANAAAAAAFMAT